MDEKFERGVIDFRNTKFVMVPHKLVLDKNLSGSDRSVYMYLCILANNTTKQSFPAIDTIATALGMSRRTIINSLAKLEELKYIEKRNRYSNSDNRQLSNVYILLEV